MSNAEPRMTTHYYGDICKPWGHLDPGQEESRKRGCICHLNAMSWELDPNCPLHKKEARDATQ